ncbi:glycosyltransferase [Oceanicoccus sp. KOV_DT_Chl]|uniref:glycosyltransferase n=1 Tax=Oceanicoccus sp. KOV_DT_Chl TaxID=1904639 RepID=UPI000C7E1250|nr:glycosyltransferase [Oceanicoccus sp. KOV_DT_Chl]
MKAVDLKVLVVSQADVHGGAARAAYRLHRALLQRGVQSQMLVAKKMSGDYSVLGPDSNPANTWADLRNYLSLPLHWLHDAVNRNLHSYNIFPSGLHKKINAMDVDVVNLHWINREMMSVAEIAKIHHPIVWTLHDMWAFCGAEHYDDLAQPERYKAGYPASQSHRGRFDLDRWVWQRKFKHWSKKPFNFVTPSVWLAQCVEQSALLRNHKVRSIPNCIDLELFRPIDKKLLEIY